MERISASTFFIKWVFPCIWLGGVGLGFVVSMVAVTSPQAADSRGLPPLLFALTPLLMLVFGFVLFRKLLWDLADSVDEGADYLLVRRGSAEQRVMLANVLNVAMSQFVNPPRVTLRLRTPGVFGDEIKFIPKSHGLRLSPFQRNEIAERLIRRVDEIRSSGAARI